MSLIIETLTYFGSVYSSNNRRFGVLKMLKTVLKLNRDGSIGIGVPAKLAHELDLNCESCVNIEKVGNSLHITKIKID